MGKLEDAAAAAEALRVQDHEDDVIDHEEDGDDAVAVKGEESSKPPSEFLSYEDYIKAGKDPKKYKGEDVFKTIRELVDDLKNTKKEVKVYTQQLMAANEATLNKEREIMKAALEKQLKEQKDLGDVEGALETKEQLTELKQEAKKGPLPINPVIQEFIEANPILDKSSKEFDEEFFDSMASLQAQHVNRLSGNGAKTLTDGQIRRCTEKAFEEAKEFYPELFKPKVSERNERQGMGRTATGKGGGDGKGQSYEVRLKNLKFADNRNPDMNANPAYDTYMHMKEKFGPKSADAFARRLLEE